MQNPQCIFFKFYFEIWRVMKQSSKMSTTLIDVACYRHVRLPSSGIKLTLLPDIYSSPADLFKNEKKRILSHYPYLWPDIHLERWKKYCYFIPLLWSHWKCYHMFELGYFYGCFFDMKRREQQTKIEKQHKNKSLKSIIIYRPLLLKTWIVWVFILIFHPSIHPSDPRLWFSSLPLSIQNMNTRIRS